MGKTWRIAERCFKDNLDLRMRLYDALVQSILLYGSKIWGWRCYEEVNRIQEKYIRWTLRLDHNTARHIMMKKTGREKITTKACK